MFRYSNGVDAASNGDRYDSVSYGQAFYLVGDPDRDKTALRVKSKKGHTVVVGGDGTDPNGHQMAAGNYILDSKIDPATRVRKVNVAVTVTDS